jgi:hypothetical protein
MSASGAGRWLITTRVSTIVMTLVTMTNAFTWASALVR